MASNQQISDEELTKKFAHLVAEKSENKIYFESILDGVQAGYHIIPVSVQESISSRSDLGVNSIISDPSKRVAVQMYKRLTGELVVNYIKQAEPKQVELIINAASPHEMMIEVIRDFMLKDEGVSPYEMSKLRAADKRKKILSDHGGLFNYKQVMKKTGWKKSTVTHNRKNLKLLGTQIEGEYKYPTFQFADSGMIKGLNEVIKALLAQNNDFWSAVVYLLDGNDLLSDDKPVTPLDVVKAGRATEVLKIIKSRFDQSGH